jgi:hypothetical protein
MQIRETRTKIDGGGFIIEGRDVYTGKVVYRFYEQYPSDILLALYPFSLN